MLNANYQYYVDFYNLLVDFLRAINAEFADEGSYSGFKNLFKSVILIMAAKCFRNRNHDRSRRSD